MAETIVVLPGDGIGPEVIAAGVKILEECASRHGVDLEIQHFEVGGEALARHGDPLPDFVLEACLKARAVLLGAVGGPRFDDSPTHLRPERALLQLRKELGLYANLRPVKLYRALSAASPLRPEIIEDTDILIVRELTGGIYFGEPRGLETRPEGKVGFNSEVYFDFEVDRIARVAFDASRKRKLHVTSVDKSNVLESSKLWREVVQELARSYPDVQVDHMLVDNCAMQLIVRPREFDVILSTNMFGDILSDEAAMLTGSIGMLPSASLGGQTGLFEPVHGTAPDIAGQEKANPLATVASVALLFRYALNREDIALEIESAIEKTLDQGHRTADIAVEGEKVISGRTMLEQLRRCLGEPA